MKEAIPNHVAIIMDGNGRWAKQRGLHRSVGHRAGVKATRQVLEACVRREIKALTLFAFSSENWNRPGVEVSTLMDLFLSTLKSELGRLHENNIRVCFIGERSAFSDKLQQQMLQAEDLTKDNTGLRLSIAVNYGGYWDITQAARNMAADVQSGRLILSDINVDNFSRYLCLADIPAPDLFIRTGGECRLSNFLLWQLAYTELYFCQTLWPDFDEAAFEQSLIYYQGRQRRFGLTSEQAEKRKRA